MKKYYYFNDKYFYIHRAMNFCNDNIDNKPINTGSVRILNTTVKFNRMFVDDLFMFVIINPDFKRYDNFKVYRKSDQKSLLTCSVNGSNSLYATYIFGSDSLLHCNSYEIMRKFFKVYSRPLTDIEYEERINESYRNNKIINTI